jgi:hypothetical protein
LKQSTMEQIHARALERNNQHRNPPFGRAELMPPAPSSGAAFCLRAEADTSDIVTTAGDAPTNWAAIIDSYRDLLAIAFGENNSMDTFERTCREADRKARPRDHHHLERLRRLLADNDISLERTWHELNQRTEAAASAVEALVYGLREGHDALLKNSNRLQRLAQLSAAQFKPVCGRVQNFKPEIATPWLSDEVAALIAKWRELHGRR